ncbi:hypothetical protein ACQVGL_00005, partial [Escherichia coli]
QEGQVHRYIKRTVKDIRSAIYEWNESGTMGVKITVQTVADHLAGSYCQEASGVYHFYAHVVAGD